MIPFGPWRPDAPGPNTGLVTVAEGCIRQTGGYGPFPQLITGDGAESLGATPRGIVSVQAPDGNWYVFAATETTIERLQSDFTWDDIETGRTLTEGEDVSFALFGSFLINTDLDSGMKAYNVVTPAGNNAVSGAPDARFVFICNNCLFALGTPSDPRRFANSDFGRYDVWSGGVAEGDSLEEGGALVGGADLGNGRALMFQERATNLITWAGEAYRVDKIADVGCVAARTIIAYNGMVAFWNDDGPWISAGGSIPVSIGDEKINRWAETNIGRQNFKMLQGTVDPVRKLFLWRIDESRVLAWSWVSGKDEFTILPHQTSALARIATPPVAIDDLTGTIDALEGSIDDLGGSSAPILGGLSTALKYATFTGSSMAALLTTCVVNSPVTGLIGWATPIDDADAGTLAIGVSDRLDTALTWKSGEGKVSSGRVPLRARGKNIAFRRSITAGATWTYANGIDHVETASGGPK